MNCILCNQTLIKTNYQALDPYQMYGCSNCQIWAIKYERINYLIWHALLSNNHFIFNETDNKIWLQGYDGGKIWQFTGIILEQPDYINFLNIIKLYLTFI